LIERFIAEPEVVGHAGGPKSVLIACPGLVKRSSDVCLWRDAVSPLYSDPAVNSWHSYETDCGNDNGSRDKHNIVTCTGIKTNLIGKQTVI
jgi:hypothetical protein